jgi:hypothetical protein
MKTEPNLAYSLGTGMVAGISHGIELKIFNLQLSRKFRVNSAMLSPNKIGKRRRGNNILHLSTPARRRRRTGRLARSGGNRPAPRICDRVQIISHVFPGRFGFCAVVSPRHPPGDWPH